MLVKKNLFARKNAHYNKTQFTFFYEYNRKLSHQRRRNKEKKIKRTPQSSERRHRRDIGTEDREQNKIYESTQHAHTKVIYFSLLFR